MDATLNDQLQGSNSVTLSDSCQLFGSPTPGLPLLRVRNGCGDAVIALQGAQLLSFTPHQGDNLLWLSPKATFETGKAIRGGVPVCLPWFGVNRVDSTKPKHGFARTKPWLLEQIEEPDANTTELTFLYLSDEQDLALFPDPFSARLSLRLSDKIEYEFEVSNHSDNDIPVSWALHSYHPVSNLAATTVEGLDGGYYLDNTRKLEPMLQTGDVTFPGEVDRVYESVSETQQITGQPAIEISGTNCPTAIVWNPGAANAAAMADLGAGSELAFVCVERGAAFANGWIIASGESLEARLTIRAL